MWIAVLLGWILFVATLVIQSDLSFAIAVILLCQGPLIMGLAYGVLRVRSIAARAVDLRRTVTSVAKHTARIESQLSDLRSMLADLPSEARLAAEEMEARILAGFGTRTRSAARENYRQLEALTNLHAIIPVDRPMPATRGFPASPDLLLLLVDLVRRDEPRLIVECGSGTSTLWLARALRHFCVDGRVVALEHDKTFTERSHQLLVDHELTSYAEVRDAPLEEFIIDGVTFHWYAADAWSNLHDVNLLFVDGPPRYVSDRARYPALPLLIDRLASDATVVVDDLIRKAERDMVDKWVLDNPKFSDERLQLEAGAAVLRRKGAEPIA